MLKRYIRERTGLILLVLVGTQIMGMFRYRFFHKPGSWSEQALDEAIGAVIVLACSFALFAFRKRNGTILTNWQCERMRMKLAPQRSGNGQFVSLGLRRPR